MTRPLVLTIAGHDPCGGAGIQADIETITALGGRALSLVTCLTAQGTSGFRRHWPVPAGVLTGAIEALLQDLCPAAVKIGLLGDAAQAALLAKHLPGLEVPLVLDPVLESGSGTPLADETLIGMMREALLPLTTLLTPNLPEALRLSGQRAPDAAAAALQRAGATWVLISGGHGGEAEIRSRLYGPGGQYEEFRHRRRPGNVHGTGCTLSAAIATLLARSLPVPRAVAGAHRFTAQAVLRAISPGGGAPIPERLDHEG